MVTTATPVEPKDEQISIDLDALDVQKAKADAQRTPAEPEIKVEAPVEAPKPDQKRGAAVVTPDEGLEKLKKQLEDEKKATESERQGRIEAERRAQEASDSEVKARTEVQGSQLDLITNAIATIEQSNEALKSAYREARANNDTDKEWELQETLSENAAKLIQLKAGEKALKNAPKPTPRPMTDPVEQFAAKLTPTSAAWVRSHPEYVRDPKKNRAMLAAHELAMSRDIAPDSEEYFQDVEDDLGTAH